MGLALGLDVSTTATKAILVDDGGTVRGVGAGSYGVSTPRPLWSEQDPDLWWNAAGTAIRAALAAADVAERDVDAVGLAGQMHQGDAVLSAGEQQYRAFKLRCYFPHNINSLMF